MDLWTFARRRAGLLALTAVVAACAGGAPPGEVTPADLATLEAQRAQTPADPALHLQLARAYYAAGRYTDARAALASSRRSWRTPSGCLAGLRRAGAV
jgi:cytochrome c-type biogenesis protein CcmH/NrfG